MCDSAAPQQVTADLVVAGYGSVILTIAPGPAAPSCGFWPILYFLSPTIPSSQTKTLTFWQQTSGATSFYYCYNEPQPQGQCLNAAGNFISSSTPIYAGTNVFSLTQPTNMWLTISNGILNIGSGSVPGLLSSTYLTIIDSTLNSVTSVQFNNLNFPVTASIGEPSCPVFNTITLDSTKSLPQQCFSLQGCFDGTCVPCGVNVPGDPTHDFCFQNNNINTTGQEYQSIPFLVAQSQVNPQAVIALAKAGGTTGLGPGIELITIQTGVKGFVIQNPSTTCNSSFTSSTYSPQCTASGTDCCPENNVCNLSANGLAYCNGFCCTKPQGACPSKLCPNNVDPQTLQQNCINSYLKQTGLGMCFPCVTGYLPKILGNPQPGDSVSYSCVPEYIVVNLDCTAFYTTVYWKIIAVVTNVDVANAPAVPTTSGQPVTSGTFITNQSVKINIAPSQELVIWASAMAYNQPVVLPRVGSVCPCGSESQTGSNCTQQYNFANFNIFPYDIFADPINDITISGYAYWNPLSGPGANTGGCQGTLAILYPSNLLGPYTYTSNPASFSNGYLSQCATITAPPQCTQIPS